MVRHVWKHSNLPGACRTNLPSGGYPGKPAQEAIMTRADSNLTFEHAALAQGLTPLPRDHRVAFAASCCERLLPNYYAFVV